MQERRNSIVNKPELHLSCTKPSIWSSTESNNDPLLPVNDIHVVLWASIESKHDPLLSVVVAMNPLSSQCARMLWHVLFPAGWASPSQEPPQTACVLHRHHLSHRLHRFLGRNGKATSRETYTEYSADSRLAPSQWEMSLQSNAVSH